MSLLTESTRSASRKHSRAEKFGERIWAWPGGYLGQTRMPSMEKLTKQERGSGRKQVGGLKFLNRMIRKGLNKIVALKQDSEELGK